MPSFFFKDTATTEIYPLSLHDALPIFGFEVSQQRAPGPLIFLRHDPEAQRVRCAFAGEAQGAEDDFGWTGGRGAAQAVEKKKDNLGARPGLGLPAARFQ